MNPLCQCGCGREVRLPQNKYVQGHGSFRRRSLTDEQVGFARQLRAAGLSQMGVAKRMGTTQTTICYRVDRGRYVAPEKHQHVIITQQELDRRFARHMLKRAKACVKKVMQTIMEFKRMRRGK